MNSEATAAVLESLSKEAEKLGNVGGLIAARLLHFAAVLVRQGKDPVDHLSRLADLNAGFDAASKAADTAAHAKFTKEEDQ